MLANYADDAREPLLPIDRKHVIRNERAIRVDSPTPSSRTTWLSSFHASESGKRRNGACARAVKLALYRMHRNKVHR
jgi:hypothetical protein